MRGGGEHSFVHGERVLKLETCGREEKGEEGATERVGLLVSVYV